MDRAAAVIFDGLLVDRPKCAAGFMAGPTAVKKATVKETVAFSHFHSVL
jgi:hypothetical protein